MILTKAVKSTALALLKDKWYWAGMVSLIPVFSLIAICLVMSLLFTVIGYWAILGCFVFGWFLISFLFLGALRMFWRCGNSIDEPLSDMFYCFSAKKNFKRAFSFAFRMLLPTLLNAAVLFLPAILVLLVANGKIFELLGLPIPLFTVGLKDLGYFLILVGFAILLIRLLKYFLAAFIFVSNEELSAGECIDAAKKVAKFTKNMFVSHIFGFSFWLIISLFVLPLVFTAPYLLMSYMVSCRYCVAHYNRLGENVSAAPIYSC